MTELLETAVLICAFCGKEFNEKLYYGPKYYVKKKPHTSMYCSETCRSEDRKIYLKNHRDGGKRTQSLNEYFENGLTKDNNHAVLQREYVIRDQRTIPYDSPTGHAFIGFAKSPLMVAVENGFGFQGVLLQSHNRTLVQCHECGKWRKIITNTHLIQHGLTTEQYKEKYGLLMGKGLVADATSYKYEANARKSLASQGGKWKKRLQKYNDKAVRKSMEIKNGSKTTKFKNDHNTCEEQVKFRIVQYMKQFKQLPGTSDKGDGRRISKILTRRYGSRNKGFAHYGLPVQYRNGTNVELKAPNGQQLFFNYNRDYNRDEVYAWMVSQCEILQ